MATQEFSSPTGEKIPSRGGYYAYADKQMRTTCKNCGWTIYTHQEAEWLIGQPTGLVHAHCENEPLR